MIKLSENKINEALENLNDWQLSADKKSVSKSFKFVDFYHTMAFVNAVAWIANQENHHPDMEIGYNYCHIKFITHSADGLTVNDFSCAMQVDLLGL